MSLLSILDVCTFALNQFGKVVEYIVNRHNGPSPNAERIKDPDYALLAGKLHQACHSIHGEMFVEKSIGLKLISEGDITLGIQTLHAEYYQGLIITLRPGLGSIIKACAMASSLPPQSDIGISFVNAVRRSYHTAEPLAAALGGGVTGRVQDLKMPFVDKSKFLHFLELLDRIRYYEVQGVFGQGLSVSMRSQTRYAKGTFTRPNHLGELCEFYNCYYDQKKDSKMVMIEWNPKKAFLSMDKVIGRLDLEQGKAQLSQILTAKYRYEEDEEDINFCRHKLLDTILGGELDSFVYYSNAVCRLGNGIGECSMTLIDLTDREECVRKFGLVGEMSRSGLLEYADKLEVMAYASAIYTSLEYLATVRFNNGFSGFPHSANPIYPTLPTVLPSAPNFGRDEGDGNSRIGF